MKGTAVSDFIKPIGWTDKYPTHLDIFGKGGLHSVATIGDRYKITLERRSEGMLSFSQDDKGMYSLLGGIDNSNWFKIFDFKDNKLNFNILCQPNYILLGDKDGVAKPSPALIDMRLDIVDVREELSTVRRLEYQHVLIGNKSGVAKPRTNIGVENLPPLGAATLPVPDISIIPGIPTSIVSLFKTITGYAYLPNPTQPVNISSLSKNFQASNVLSWAMGGAWLPQIFVGSPGKVDPTPRETEASSALALTAVSLARAHKLLGNSSFIVSSKKVEFQWENELANLFASNPSTKPIAKLYGYQNTYEYGEDRSPDALDQPEQPRVQALDELDRGMLWNSGKKAEGEPGTYKAGTLRQAISGEDYVNTATIPAGPLVIMDPLYPSPGHKLIAPTKFNIRKGKESEFGKVRDPQSQQIPEFEVLEGEYAKFKNIGLSSTDFSAGSLLKVNEKGL
jgi:hypothetical protein